MKKLGIITIGQTPRVDLIPEIKPIFGENVEIIERGALDGLSLEEVEVFYPSSNDEVLVTRMADGKSVKIAERYIYPRLQEQIKRLEFEGIQIVLIACTGEFSPFDTKSLIIYPQKVLYHVTASMAQGLRLGVLIPDRIQTESAQKRWSSVAKSVFIESGSPYDGIEAVLRAAQKLKPNVDIVVMDCIGYTIAMKEAVARSINKPLLLARSVVARVVSEIL